MLCRFYSPSKIISNIIFDKKILSVLPSVVVRPSVPVPHLPQKLRYFRVFSLFNVILCRPPGGARQYPRSGYFLVYYNSIVEM